MQQKIFRRIVSLFVLAFFVPASVVPASAQSLLNSLPPIGRVLSTSQPYTPVLLNGMALDPGDPLRFDFIVDRGDDHLDGEPLLQQARKSVRYFLAALTVPEKDMWVNLSPYDKDKMLPDDLGRTEMGEDLLAQDYLLKQLTASLTYPEERLGRDFWDRVYRRAYEKFGTTKVPLNAFSKVWIVPDHVLIYEKGARAFIVESRLKVMMEQDFIAWQKVRSSGTAGVPGSISRPSGGHPATDVSSSVLREVIIPAIEKEVNEGRHFASLRQIYHAVILASWFKDRLKRHILSRTYVNQGKTRGVEPQDQDYAEVIYNRYLQTFRSGVYSLIKETYDPVDGRMVPRRYVSGGTSLAGLRKVRRITTDPDRLTASSAVSRDYMEVPVEVKVAQEAFKLEEDIRDKTTGEIVHGSPQNLAPWARVLFPRPANRLNNRGDLIAFWAMTNALAEILLEVKADKENPFVLDEKGTVWVINHLSGHYGLSNIVDPDLGFKVQDLFVYLRDLGFLEEIPLPEGSGQKFYIKAGMEAALETWARLHRPIAEELDKVFASDGTLRGEALLGTIARYEQAARLDPLSLVEPYQPFLRAVLSLPARRRKQIADFLYEYFVHREGAPLTGGPLVDGLLLMFGRMQPEELLAWAKKAFPEMTREGRRVYLVAPEITLLKGGLGRVMQYLGRAMKAVGVDVVFMEPRYDKEFIYDEKGEIVESKRRDYTNLLTPLRMSDEPIFTYTVDFGGRGIEVQAYEAENDEGIPVYLFRDKEGYYVQDVYYEGPGAPPKDEAALFLGKAAMGLMQELETRRKSEAEKAKKPWASPVIALNDGQVLAGAVFRLFDASLQGEPSLTTHVMATGHTVKNTLQVSQEALRKAGVPEMYWWLFKMKTIWGNEDYDASKAGLLASLLTGGGGNNVSEEHRNLMARYFPSLGGLVYGVTNGDLISLTMREWNRTFVDMGFAGEEARKELMSKEEALGRLEAFERAAKRREIDDFLNGLFWRWWDDAGVGREQRIETVKSVKRRIKKDLFFRILSDAERRRRLGIVIPESYAGREGEYLDQLAEDWSGRLVKAYSGRGVGEKLGLSRAHTFENLENRAKLGIVTIIQGNKQFYPGTNEPGQSVALMNRLIDWAAQINSKGYPGAVIIQDRFGLDDQLRLLGAADIMVLDSDTLKIDGQLVPTGASESTEVHAVGLMQGPAELHGFINYIAALGDYEKGTGTLFTPKDSRPESAGELDALQAGMFAEGKLDGMLLEAVDIFRAIDVQLTVAGYLRLWEEKVAAEEKRRKDFARRTGKSIPEGLREEYARMARPEGEVLIHDVSAAVIEEGGRRREDLSVQWEDGRQVIHLLTAWPVGRMEISLRLKPQKVPGEDISAMLMDRHEGRVFPMSLREIRDGEHRFAVSIPARQWRRWQEGGRLTFMATGGSWYETRDVVVSRRLPQWEREQIRQGIAAAAGEGGRLFNVTWLNGRAGDREAVIARGEALGVRIEVPLADRTALHRLKVGAYVQASGDHQWRFLRPTEYTAKAVWREGRAVFNIRFVGIFSDTDMTFALFDADEDLSLPGVEERAIAWANTPGDNLTVIVKSTPRERDEALRRMERQASSGVHSEEKAEAPGGIQLDPSLMDVQLVSDDTGRPGAAWEDLPDDFLFMEGLAPVLSSPQPITNLPAFFGLNAS